MKEIDPGSIFAEVQPLLINGEEVIGAYKAMRDYCRSNIVQIGQIIGTFAL